MRATQEAQRVAALQANAVRGALDHGVIDGPRNLNYKVQGASDLQPSEISDNGQFTVLRFPGNHEIPAIYLVRPDGSESLVPFDVRDEFVVRSEEHTSELQSLMRISYAVFRLKKKILL